MDNYYSISSKALDSAELFAVLMLDSPQRSGYETSFYQQLWTKYNSTHPSTDGAENNNNNNNTYKHRPIFICADGAARFLAPSLSDKNDINKQFCCDVVCGDFDSYLSGSAAGAATMESFSGTALSQSRIEKVATVDAVPDDTLHTVLDATRRNNNNNNNDKRPLTLVVEDQDSSDFGKCIRVLERLWVSAAAETQRRVKKQQAQQEQAPTAVVGENKNDDKNNNNNNNIEASSLSSPPPEVPSSLSDEERPPSTVLVLGGQGGRFDHTLGVVHMLLTARTSGPLRLVLHDALNTVIACHPRGVTTFRHDAAVDDETCGLLVFGPPTAAITSTGLEWNISREIGPMGFGYGLMQSTSNRIVAPEVVIDSSQCDTSHTAMIFTVARRKR